MSINFEDNSTMFSGMFSLVFPSREGSSLRLPKIEPFEGISEAELIQKPKIPLKSISKKRSRKRITACPHVNKRYYARSMCNNCYHKIGRQKKAWNCQHTDRQLYAKGLCQKCYLQDYHSLKSCKADEEKI
ncbi:unnamed protein product [Blepharisma stoltei]|uniref:Uncharacterized protein n=1 Tax=Blepharisma stoltei TaxID=1481888 RepID=A0AAU9KBV8_9CILI|nr:unnamed protein product [Blepharisma stoltei]